VNGSRYRTWRSTPLLLAVCLALAGCYKWVPIDEVSGAEERRAETGKTVALVAGGIVTIGLVAIVATAIIVMGDPNY